MDEMTRTQRRISNSDPNPTYAGMTVADKTRENRLRRRALRRGLVIHKERGGGYMLVDVNTNAIVAGGHPIAFAFNMDDIEAWLD